MNKIVNWFKDFTNYNGYVAAGFILLWIYSFVGVSPFWFLWAPILFILFFGLTILIMTLIFGVLSSVIRG